MMAVLTRLRMGTLDKGDIPHITWNWSRWWVLKRLPRARHATEISIRPTSDVLNMSWFPRRSWNNLKYNNLVFSKGIHLMILCLQDIISWLDIKCLWRLYDFLRVILYRRLLFPLLYEVPFKISHSCLKINILMSCICYWWYLCELCTVFFFNLVIHLYNCTI